VRCNRRDRQFCHEVELLEDYRTFCKGTAEGQG
jgi:hypothetical protein